MDGFNRKKDGKGRVLNRIEAILETGAGDKSLLSIGYVFESATV